MANLNIALFSGELQNMKCWRKEEQAHTCTRFKLKQTYQYREKDYSCTVSFVAFGEAAEKVGDMTDGTQVLVQGRNQTECDDRGEEKIFKQVIKVQEVDILSGAAMAPEPQADEAAPPF